MKMRGIAIAALCAGMTHSQAQNITQSSLLLYGIVDAAVMDARFLPSGSMRAVTANGVTASRLGFRGIEDLGDGLRAGFQLELGFFPDVGTQANATTFFSRGAYLSLGSDATGEIRLGRQRSPMFWVLLENDPSAYGIATLSSMGTLGAAAANVFGLYDNSFVYRTPAWRGFTSELHYSLGAESPAPLTANGRSFNANVQYKVAPLSVGVGYSNTRGVTATGSSFQDAYLFGTKYVWGPVTLAFDAIHGRRNTPGAPVASTAYGVQTKVHVGNGDIDFGVANLNQSGGGRAKALHAGYIHTLSKRTGLYVYMGRVLNNDLTAVNLSGDVRNAGANGLVSPAGFDPAAVVVGIKHSF